MKSTPTKPYIIIPWYKKFELMFPLGLFITGLFVRMLYLSEIASIPYFNSPIIDPKQYDTMARLILSGDMTLMKSLYQAPFYSYFLAGIYKYFGTGYGWPHVIHGLLGACNAVLVYFIALKCFSKKTAILSSIITVFYGTFIFYEGDLFRENLLLTMLLVLTLIVVSEIIRLTAVTSYKTVYMTPSKYLLWFTAGLIFALCVITRENMLVLLPLLVAVIWLLQKVRVKTKAILTICILIPLAYFLYNLAKMNYEAEGSWELTSSQGGLNLYIGNNPDMDKTTTLQPGIDWEIMSSLPLHKAQIYSSKGQSKWFYDETIKFIKNNPKIWLKLMFKKFYIFWAGYEMMPNEDLELYRQYSNVLKPLIWRTKYFNFPFGLIVPLAFIGMFYLFKKPSKERMYLFLVVMFYMFSVIAFHVRARYRLPVVPILIIFASYGILSFIEDYKNSIFSKKIKLVAVFTVLVLLLNLPFYNFSYAEKFPSDYAVGKVYYDAKKYPLSEKYLKLALQGNESVAEAYNDLGILYLDQNKYDLAVENLKKSIALRPDFDRMQISLGRTYMTMNKPLLAADAFEAALKINKYNPQAYVELAEILTTRNPKRAKELFYEVLNLAKKYPEFDAELLRRTRNGLWKLGDTSIDDTVVTTDKMKKAQLRLWQKKSMDIIGDADLSTQEGRTAAAEAWSNLGVGYLRNNEFEEAEKCLLKSLEITYNQTAAHVNIAIVYKKKGKYDEALKHYELALKISPDSYLVINNIGTIYRDLKQYDKAMVYLKKALALKPDNATIQRNIMTVKERMKKQDASSKQ